MAYKGCVVGWDIWGEKNKRVFRGFFFLFFDIRECPGQLTRSSTSFTG